MFRCTERPIPYLNPSPDVDALLPVSGVVQDGRPDHMSGNVENGTGIQSF